MEMLRNVTTMAGPNKHHSALYIHVIIPNNHFPKGTKRTERGGEGGNFKKRKTNREFRINSICKAA